MRSSNCKGARNFEVPATSYRLNSFSYLAANTLSNFHRINYSGFEVISIIVLYNLSVVPVILFYFFFLFFFNW